MINLEEYRKLGVLSEVRRSFIALGVYYEIDGVQVKNVVVDHEYLRQYNLSLRSRVLRTKR